MAICEQCKAEYEAKRATSKYCSDKCRKLAFQGANGKVSVPMYLTDTCGGKHKIDYEGRRRDRETLEFWVEGTGDSWKRQLGILATQYTGIKGVDMDRYLGHNTHQAAQQAAGGTAHKIEVSATVVELQETLTKRKDEVILKAFGVTPQAVQNECNSYPLATGATK